MDKRIRQGKTLIRLYKLYAKMDLTWLPRSTKYCLPYVSTDLICLFASMVDIPLLSARFEGFGGMTETEVLFMLGCSTLTDGIYMMLFMGNNTSMVSRIIGREQLDHVVIQPVSIWMHLLCQGFSPASMNFTLLCGIFITGFALRRLPAAVTPLFLLAVALSALASCLIPIAVIYLISCLAFYVPAAAEEVAQLGLDLFTVKTYPLGGLGGRVKLLFCTAVPVRMGVWLPSRALLQLGYGYERGANAAAAILSLIAVPALAMFLVTSMFMIFKKGMNHCETNGFPGYSGLDHR